MDTLLRKISFTLLAAVCFFCFGPVTINVSAEEGSTGVFEDLPIPIELDAEVAIYSNYVWRGILLDDDPVIQPSVTIGAYGFSANFWSSFDLVEHDGLGSDEVDANIDYTYEHDLFSLFAGHTWYYFPNAHADTQEFYLGGGVNIPLGDEITLSPSATWIHDYGDTADGGAKGDYFIFDLAHSIPLFESSVTLDLSGEIGYNSGFFIAGDGGYVLLGAGLTIPLYGETVTLAPNFNYSIPFADLADSSDGNQDDEIYFGSVLAFSF